MSGTCLNILWYIFQVTSSSCIQKISTNLITYLLTYSMVQSLYWEANWFATSQEIPHISPNPKVHYRTHKRPPLVSIQVQPNPVHIPTSHHLEIHPNIIHPSTPRSPQWSLSLRFPHQDPIHPPLLTHMRYMPSPSHTITLCVENSIIRILQWWKLNTLYFVISNSYLFLTLSCARI